MARLYYNKIRDKAYNKNTGKAWELADVPPRWYDEVAEMLAED